MKKILSIAFVAFSATVLAACSSQNQAKTPTSNSDSEQVVKSFSEWNYDGTTRYWYITGYNTSETPLSKETSVSQIVKIKNGKLESYDLANPDDDFSSPRLKDLKGKSDEAIFKDAKKNAKKVFKEAASQELDLMKKNLEEFSYDEDKRTSYQNIIDELNALNYNTFYKKAVKQTLYINVQTDDSGNNSATETIGKFPKFGITGYIDDGTGKMALTDNLKNIEDSVSAKIYKDTYKGLTDKSNYTIVTRELKNTEFVKIDSPDDKHVKVDEKETD